METLTLDNAETTILARVIAPEAPTLPAAVARELLKWGFAEADQRRMGELAAKARTGSLLPGAPVEWIDRPVKRPHGHTKTG